MKTKAMSIEELKELLTESKNGEGVKLECIDGWYTQYHNRITVLAVGNNGYMCAIDGEGDAFTLNEFLLKYYASHKEPKLTECFEWIDRHAYPVGYHHEHGCYPDFKNKKWVAGVVHKCPENYRKLNNSIWIDEDFNIVENKEGETC